MYAQCPACLTTYKVTPAQLAARGGVVRCGICSAIFHAEQRLLQAVAQDDAEKVSLVEDKSPTNKKNRRRHSDKNQIAASRRRRQSTKSAAPEELAIPTVTEFSGRARPDRRWRTVLWGFGDLLLLALLAGQFVFFYTDELAANPSWRPRIAQFCRHTGCELHAQQDVTQIDLLQTSIAPHPQYENALRIRATLVNRAAFAQAYPWMEVSLTNNAGSVIARRTFSPSQYLEAPATGALTPNVVATTLLDITNPEGKAVGYEIRLVTP
ncbi:MAG: zinc-ribbon and DUF3426 domain-containing protein [Sulfuricaulis sp.]